jgi:protein phosphatase
VEKLQGRSSGRVREFCFYGDTTGETDEFGLPVRLNWAEEYRGRALVVYGHIPSREARFLNNTVCIDTGCVFGGALSAFRYPEKELVRVPAKQEYYAPVKPLDYGGAQTASGETPAGALPAISDVLGRRSIRTRFHRDIIIAEESSAAALEIMSRFSADPRWLIYLPPTMSPCAVNDGANTVEQYLEYPFEAFEYFLKAGQERVVCEQKHMGSRAVIVLCRDEEIARRRFAVDDGSTGIIYTRTGRRFFDPGEAETGTAILLRLREALNKSGFWERFSTGWVCLDTELMPWSAKARSLLLEQYAPVGRAGQDGLTRAIDALEKAAALLPAEGTTILPDTMDIPAVLEQFSYRKECLGLYTEAYRRYCWPVTSVDDYRVAPFHILATEGKVWNDENHRRHLDLIREYITGEDSLFAATGHIAVELRDKASVSAGINWWLELTTAGGEGMVVKPLDFIARGKKAELLQPAVKCRGREYLRIIYGPEYTAPEKLARLRTRSLTKKRRLALAEFALGMESLERFVRQEPLHRVHECVFAVLALENETVDPRL